jgi:bifunctional DNase/RNase
MYMKCTAPNCSENAAIYITEVKNGSYVRQDNLCEHHAQSHEPFPDWGNQQSTLLPRSLGSHRCFKIRFIVYCERPPYSGGLYLSEVAGTRKFAIGCGYFEATAIFQAVKAEPMPRPWTFPAMALIMRALGGELQDVYINEYDEQQHYHAQLRIRHGNRLVSVDLRPSDAFALALLSQAPILVTDEVLAKVPNIPCVNLQPGRLPR